MKALFLNCTLKKSPAESNTEVLIDEAIIELSKMNVDSEVIRPVDYYIAFGTSTRNDDVDQWPEIIEKIRKCQILVIATPIWVGYPSSITQMVIEKLDAMFYEEELQSPDNKGQYLLYNKVAGVMVTGNEDGAQCSIARIQMALNQFGATLPPNAISYWVGEAGQGINYGEIAGREEYTNEMTTYMVFNLVTMALLLESNPIALSLKALDQEAKRNTVFNSEE